jgi:hypothetical protein
MAISTRVIAEISYFESTGWRSSGADIQAPFRERIRQRKPWPAADRAPIWLLVQKPPPIRVEICAIHGEAASLFFGVQRLDWPAAGIVQGRYSGLVHAPRRRWHGSCRPGLGKGLVQPEDAA